MSQVQAQARTTPLLRAEIKASSASMCEIWLSETVQRTGQRRGRQ